MNSHERSRILSQFRHQLTRALFLKKTVLLTAVFLLLWGIAVLALRASGIYDLTIFGVALLAFAVVPPLAWVAARGEVPGDEKLGAILDRDNEAGGLLMSSFERELGPWERQMVPLRIPKTRWESRRGGLLVFLAASFAVATLLLPGSAISGPNQRRLNIDDQIRRLTTQLDVLEEEQILTPEEVESRKLDLKKIQEEADGMGPVKTLDAMDHLYDRMNQKAAEAVEEAQRNTETLAEAEALTRQVKDLTHKLDSTTAKSLMDGLAETLEEMLAENEGLADQLKEELEKKKKEEEKKKEKGEGGDEQAEDGGQKEGGEGEQQENGQGEQQAGKDGLQEALKQMLDENNLQNMTPEMLEQLCEAMKNCQGNSERMCENLQNAGFPMDPETLKKLAESQQVDKEEAERMLSDLWQHVTPCNGEGEGGEGEEGPEFSPRFTEKPDSWATDPNAPPGKHRFQMETNEEGAEFQAQFLPPGELEAFRNAQKIGASISAPEFDPAGTKGDHGGAVQETGGGTGTAHGQTIYPQHRGPVGRYFDR